jgi:hypothetical protein
MRMGFCGLPVSGLDGGVKGPIAFRTVLRKFVRAAADTDVDDGSGGATVLRAVVVGFDAELVDGIRGGRNGLVGEALVGGAIGVVVETVEEEVVELAALAVDVEGGVAAGVGGVFEEVAAYTGYEGGEVGVGATIEWQVLDLAGTDHLTAFAIVCLQ